MVQALFATCKHILYGIENDKIEMGQLFKRNSSDVNVS